MTPDTRVSCGTAPPRFLCGNGLVGARLVDERGPPADGFTRDEGRTDARRGDAAEVAAAY